MLELVERPAPEPGPGEILLQHTAIGLNFIDVYYRTGLYLGPQFPFCPGEEGAGVVAKVGSGVSDLKVGDRVGYAAVMGAYCAQRTIAAGRVVRLPAHVSDEIAAASLLKGMTAEYLLRRAFRVEPGHTVLFHAAAGGVGSIACQWCKALGARVIGTVGSHSKVAQAKDNGCDEVLLCDDPEWPAKVRELTQGLGCDVVYDGVGQATFAGSLESVKPRGMLVPFGNASGKVPPLDVIALTAKGSLFLTRPKLNDYIAKREELEASSSALFSLLEGGSAAKLKVRIGARFPLQEAGAAHIALQARQTTGSTLLLPTH